jgi:hypothetical protein
MRPKDKMYYRKIMYKCQFIFISNWLKSLMFDMIINMKKIKNIFSLSVLLVVGLVIVTPHVVAKETFLKEIELPEESIFLEEVRIEKKALRGLLQPIKQIITQLTIASPLEGTSLLDDIQLPNELVFLYTTKQDSKVSDVFNSAALSLPQKISHKTRPKLKSSLGVELPDESLF